MQLLFLLFSVLYTPYQDPCNVTAEVAITEYEGFYDASVTLSDKSEGYKYYFFNAKSELISEDINSNTIRILKKGDYYCVVIGDEKCGKRVDFKVG